MVLMNRSETKRNMEDVDWNAAVADVDWKTVDWSSVFNSPSATPTPAQVNAEEAPASSVPEVVTSAAPEPTSEKATPTSTEAAEETGSSGDSSGFSNVMNNIIDTLSISSEVASPGIAWEGGDSKWKATIINDADEDCVMVCWTTAVPGNDYGGFFISIYGPNMFGIKAGQSKQISFKEDTPMACSFAFPDTEKLPNGQLAQSWLEMNFVQGHGMGAFDVSREVFMNGNVISAKGSKCTSGVSGGQLSCVFGCKDSSLSTCGEFGSYAIFGADTGSGCMNGLDAGAAAGGCGMGADSEHMEVTIYGSKDWPA